MSVSCSYHVITSSLLCQLPNINWEYPSKYFQTQVCTIVNIYNLHKSWSLMWQREYYNDIINTMCLCQIWLSTKSQYKCGPPQSLYTESLSVNYSSPVSCAKNTKSIVAGTMQTEYKLNFNGKKKFKVLYSISSSQPWFYPPQFSSCFPPPPPPHPHTPPPPPQHRHTHTHTQRRGGEG